MKKLFLILSLLGITFTISAQNISVKGIVVDNSDESLPGVNVIEKGSAGNGTITDLDGQFTLTVPSDAVLTISYIGYKSLDIPVKGQTSLRIVLQEDTETLDEVVVIGYGVQKKSVVTAAISRVSADELNLAKPSRVEDVLKGKVSGVQITQSTGQPGSDSKVRIRGIGTINNSDPLYIIDGMPVGGGFNYLNPADIESVEILKDAASAAIYGTRGANGVILVTTKSGSKGKATINYDFSYGWQNPWKKKSVLDAREYMVIMNESQINDGNAIRYSKDEIAQAGKGTDWQDETFNYDAPIQTHQLSINGGNEKMQYYLSMGYFSQEGIVGGNYGRSNYDRWTIRTNSTYEVFEALDRNYLNKARVGLNVSYARSKNKTIEANSEYGSILGSALAFNPLIPVYATDPKAVLAEYPNAVKDKNGNVFSLPPSGFQEIANPVAMLNQPRSDKNNDDKFVGSLWAELDIIPGLKFKSSYSFDLAFWGNDGYEYPYFLASQGKKVDQSSVWSSMNRGYTWLVENVVTYNKTFAEKHNVTVVLGQSGQRYRTRKIGGSNYQLLDNDPNKANIDSGIIDPDEQRVYGGTEGFNHESLASYFGRLDYNFDERYMMQLTMRRDGSSKFGPKNKWATFPAVSLGWNVFNEAFMENRPDWFNSLKLRFSWGKNGNDKIDNFLYTSLLDGGQNYYFGGGYSVADGKKNGTMQYGTSPARIANPDIKWEESEQIDLGFETRFLNNALNFTFDYYKKKTNGMLMYLPIPNYVGIGAPMGNVGDMENWGLEFELGWKHNIGDFNYSVSANATYTKNKLIKLGNASGEEIYESAGASGVGSYVKGENGMVWPYFYGYKTNGLFQNQAEIDGYVNAKGEKMQPKAQPGDVRFVDYNGDGSIDDNDKTKIGKGMPDWNVGLNISADWKGFDLNLFFQGTFGNDIFDFSQRGDIPAMNRPTWVLDRWHGEGTSNKIPRITTANPNSNWRSSDLYIKNGSFVRLRTIQLGYTLPSVWTKKVSLQRFRVFVNAENLFTFTGYDGFDPEVASGNYTTIGVDRGVYPQSRTISVGANVTF